jgi:hypothetical protein
MCPHVEGFTPIPSAYFVHHISNDDLVDKPGFPEVFEAFCRWVTTQTRLTGEEDGNDYYPSNDDDLPALQMMIVLHFSHLQSWWLIMGMHLTTEFCYPTSKGME